MNIVPLLESLANEILAAEELFLKNPKDFHSLEISVKSSTESFAASFLGEVLSTLNSCIFESGWRKERYTSHRLDKRTLISSVGDKSSPKFGVNCLRYNKYQLLSHGSSMGAGAESRGHTCRWRFSPALWAKIQPLAP